MASSRMIALLGLLAVAGYQNRERLGEMLGRVTGQRTGNGPMPDPASSSVSNAGAGGIGGLLGGLGGLFGGGGSAGGGLAGGLSDLVESFTGRGQGAAANSWVQTGPNRELSSTELDQALGSDTIQELTRQTGLSRDELLSRLKTVLPVAVDKMTPEGRLPTEAEAAQLVRQ